MKITVLSENTSCREDILSEHGLSLFIQTENHRFLFDMGHSDNFVKNADTLDINLNSVEFTVLSHGHYDHGGGLAKFIELNNHAPIYMSQYAYEPHYHDIKKYIGLDKSTEKSKQIKFVTVNESINEECQILLLNQENLTEQIRPYGLHTIRDNQFIDEDFRHEIYLLVNQNNKRILFSGCSHRGIINIVDATNIERNLYLTMQLMELDCGRIIKRSFCP